MKRAIEVSENKNKHPTVLEVISTPSQTIIITTTTTVKNQNTAVLKFSKDFKIAEFKLLVLILVVKQIKILRLNCTV